MIGLQFIDYFTLLPLSENGDARVMWGTCCSRFIVARASTMGQVFESLDFHLGTESIHSGISIDDGLDALSSLQAWPNFC